MDDLLNGTKRDDCRQTATDFDGVWLTFSQQQQKDVMEIANIMRADRMVVFPFFMKYFNAVVVFQKNKVQADVWQEWNTTMLAVINNQKTGNNKQYEAFLDFSYNLFSQDALYVTQGRVWKSSSKNYTFSLDNREPILQIPSLNLVGSSANDSIRVKQTSGVYYPLQNKWIGKNGKADWTRAGLPAENAYVNFGHYQIDLAKSEYTVDSALLNYSTFSNKNVSGKFSDKLLSDYNKETATYPRFDSYRKDLNFKNIAPYVQLTSGISLQGPKMSAYGTNDQPATIKIQRYDKLVGVIARSDAFEIKSDKISAVQAEVSLMLDKDSLYHGGATMRYDINTRQLLIFRGNTGIAKTPFRDYYHKTDIYADVIFWDMTGPQFYIRNLTTAGQAPVSYESFSYFDKKKLDKYQNISDYNILEKIKTIAEKSGQREFDANDLAKRINSNYSEETLKGIYYKLVEDGFIQYDDQRGLITVLDKAFFYVNANKKLVDYDNIHLTSKSDSVNGQMDMRNLNLSVKGVNTIPLSDSNFVVIFPRKDSLVIKHNRSMDFSGSMFAGWLDISGKGFTYNYDENQMKLSTVDSVLINIPTGKFDENHQPIVGPIKSIIQNVTGTLQVDAKNNKAGNGKHLQYPILTTTQPSFVFYDNKKIFNGIYKRDKFYFQLDPFTLDSLNNLHVSKIGFDGKLVSAGIFPDVKDRVSIQPDLSLGFKTTKTDLSMYGGKGTYSNEITLNNTGLRGKGTIKFLSSITKSKDIVFLPDTLTAKADSFNITAALIGKTEFPNVKGAKGTILWKPSHDSMIVKTDSVPFKIFDGKSTLSGTVVLRSSGMRGSGTVDWADAILTSHDILFGRNKMSADTSDFYIKSKDPKQPSLQTKNVKAKIDFDKRLGEFKSNTSGIATTFPYNQYRTSISEFKWEMDNNRMTFSAPAGSQAKFTSINPEQDSLSFSGSGATYDMKLYVLKIAKVPYITVADAKIFPDSGKVTIEANAAMRTLKKAKITMDTTTAYHKFDSVTANIYGKRNFTATGIYNYTNKTGKPQRIRIDDMGVFKDTADHLLHVYAKGGVDTSMNFKLIPKVSYKGKVDIVSNKPNVRLKGYAKLDINNPKIRAEWFSINSSVTKDSNYVYYNNPVNESHKPVTAGIVFDADSSDLYTSFFNAKKSYRDKNLFMANGLVYYDEKGKQFVAGDPDKILRGATKGNVLKYNDATGKVTADGKMDMSLNFGLVKVDAAGTANTDVSKNDFVFDLMIGIQFDLDKDLLTKFSKDIVEGNYDAAEGNSQSDAFQRNISELIDPKNEKSYNDQMASTNSFFRSKALPYTIFISDVEMKWDKTSRAFYSVKPFTIAFVGDKSVLKVLKGYIELGYKRSGDYMNLYIPAGPDNWYFFNYASGNMLISSGNEDFNTALSKINPDKRTSKSSEENGNYQYNPGSENKKNTFVNRMKFLQTSSASPAPPKPKQK